MERTKIAGLLLVASLATISLAGALTCNYSASTPTTVDEALGTYTTALQQRLYPVDDDKLSAVEKQTPAHTLYITYKDKSTEDVLLVGGGTDRISSQWYYPEQPGESGRRPYIKRLYAPGNVLVDEQVQQLNGLLLKTTQYTPAAKSRYIVDYAPDGKTHLREQLFFTPDCCSGEVVKRDEKWRDDAEHSLAYRNVYNADDTRNITVFDNHMHVLQSTFWPKYESISGMRMQKYYPDTFTLRMDALGDYNLDTVKYFRKDGTLEAIVKISTGTTGIEYYDATGTKERLEQYWFRTDTKTDGKVTNSTYKLYYVTIFDAQGVKTRQVQFQDTNVYREEYYNVTVDGVHFVEVDYDYEKDQTVKAIRYWKDEVKFPPYKLEEHTSADKLTFAPYNADDARLQIDIDTDLPIPPPQMEH